MKHKNPYNFSAEPKIIKPKAKYSKDLKYKVK